jgi:hypothetical protein
MGNIITWEIWQCYAKGRTDLTKHVLCCDVIFHHERRIMMYRPLLSCQNFHVSTPTSRLGWHFSKKDTLCHWNRSISPLGCAMSQAVNRGPLTAEARVHARLDPWWICGGQSGTRTGFSRSSSVFPCQYHSTVALHTNLWYEQYVH